MSKSRYILTIIILILVYAIYFLNSFDNYEQIELLPEEINVRQIKNNPEYQLTMLHSFDISYHDRMSGRYFKREAETKMYSSVPVILSIDSQYLILGASNSSFDDGISFFLPIEYTNIDIYNIDLTPVQNYKIKGYLKFACILDKKIYLIFDDDSFGVIKEEELQL